MKNTMIGLAAVAFLNAGCASMMPAPADKIATLPVVKMGATPPAAGEFVLHIPANSPVPLKVATSGSLVKADQSVIGNVMFTRDIYLYKYWSSYDRKTWENSHKLLDVRFNGGIDASGLNVNVGLDMNR